MNNSSQSSNFIPVVQVSGYQITDPVYLGSRTLVYRAIRNQDQLPVVIKLLKNEYPTFHELFQFRNQYTITKDLDIPGIIHPYSLETCGNSYALVMEDVGGISLREYTQNRPLELKEFLKIALQIVDILQGLYKHRLIHKDIKPANILINPQTQQIKLIDFSIASLLSRETQEIRNPNVLEGTLAYLSPEQTGRMNRGIDYRSDFYALGVTFYELLSGELPFAADDPMELVHCHIAKKPPSLSSHQSSGPQEHRQEIPQVLDQIIGKLMAKNAEDRYQSVLGIKYDLETCLLQLEATGEITDFVIAQRDVGDRFMIPDKLYGREMEVQQLLTAFERVTNPAQSPTLGKNKGSEIVLVAGFSGIGKTAIIKEIHKPIVRQRGYFIQGKFDQFNRNIPLSAFVQAFRDLMEQLLTESEQQLQQWQQKIISALGENAQVIIQVIPELEKIIGLQPPALELSGTAAQNRFDFLFQQFLQVFTAKAHPLVIFLDDLQWADSASLRLIQLLVRESLHRHLLLIGAYRDNEVSSAHPLILTLKEIQQAGIEIQTITLQNLQQPKLNQLVADTLGCSKDLAENLSRLVYQKTQGNPFFTTQFLKSLYEDGLIQFDENLGCWQCDIVQVNQQAVTDNVVEFMALQLQKLSVSTQEILQLAACIGNQFDLATLVMAAERSELEVAADLWQALEAGVIIPTGDVYNFWQSPNGELSSPALDIQLLNPHLPVPTYKFLHDRIQQAAYSLIPDDQKEATHLKLGQLLLNSIGVVGAEEKIFQLVSQLNMGWKLITQPHKREELARLNLVAGQKAIAATAYTAAMEYLTIGLELLDTNSWQHQYNLTLELQEALATAAYLNTNFEQALQLTTPILNQARQILDKVKAYELIIQIYIAQDQQIEAIETGSQVLEQLGISLRSPEAYQQQVLAQIPILDDLANIPAMTDLKSLAALRLLVSITPPIHHVRPEMYPSVTITSLHVCLGKGNSSLAAFAYGSYGIFLCMIVQDVDNAYHCGQISLKLLEQYPSQNISSKVYMMFGVFVCAYKEHARNTFRFLRDSVQCGLEGGDIEHAGYSLMAECAHLFLIGENLDTVATKQAQAVELLLSLKQRHSLDYAKIWRQATLNLLGRSTNQDQLISNDFNEVEVLAYLHSTHNHQLLFAIHVAKTAILYTFDQYASALESAEQAHKYIDGAFGLLLVAGHNFYHSLCLLAKSTDSDREILNQVENNQKSLHFWANYAPMNFQHKYDLVAAEIARIKGEQLEAIDLYDRAIALAKEHGYLQEEALANELAAKFYLNWGKQRIAQSYMIEAYYGYARWGAKAKTADLEKHYPQLLAPIRQQTSVSFSANETVLALETVTSISSSASTNSVSRALDLATILKASQTISGEIELEKLLSSLLEIVITNAGADKCVLMLVRDEHLLIEGSMRVGMEPVMLQHLPVAESLEVPLKLVYKVKYDRQSIVLLNATTDAAFAHDPYIINHQPQSVLGSPIVYQGKLLGILYLENNLATGAFTSDRVELLNLICTQAAISLENARLYEQEQQKSQALEEALKDLQNTQLQLVQGEKMSALGNLVAGVAHEMNNPLGFIAASLTQLKPNFMDIVEHLKLYQESLPNPSEQIRDHSVEIDLEYSLEDLPRMINSMEMACDRLKNISTSLRTFSRADQDYKVPFNIHEGLDSTILILKHRLKANDLRPAIEVVTNYGNLPPIECFPGQLNQVFMNILANAIDALEEANQGRSFAEIQANLNQITITTSVIDRHVQISIMDNGKGMSEEIKNKVFNHLFTTKEVGKGTGLGLAIARQIIEEKHGGFILVNSILGTGTEFIITLPIKAI